MHRMATNAVMVAAAVLGAGLGVPAEAAETTRSRHVYGMVSFTEGQTIRLHVVNTLPPGPTRGLPPSPIRVRLSLFDASGKRLATQRADLAAGQADSLTFTRSSIPTLTLPAVQVRAQVDVIGTRDIPPDPCVSTLEVAEESSGRTTVLLSPAAIRGFNPQPDPPREILEGR